MENFKTNLDRPIMSTEEIASKQNFNNVLSKFNQAKVPAYKSPWFWGSAGLASLGILTVVSLNALTPNKEIDDKIITQNNKSLPADTECIKAPIKGEDVPFSTYQVDSQKDETIVLPSGTTIEIEKGSLIAPNSKQKVDIEIREFRDQASVFIAGIPMDYQKSAFESAGMIEIVGKQNGKIVDINPEKPIEILLATTKDPESFAFWNLNQNEKVWQEYPCVKSTTSTENSSISSQQKTLNKEIKSIDKQISSIEKEISNLHKPTPIEFKIPEENAQKFDLDFDKNEYPELASFKNVVFELTENDPNFNKNSTKVWPEIDLQKNKDKYTVIFKNNSETYRVNVRPTLTGSDLKLAKKDFENALTSFHSVKKEKESEKVALQARNIENQRALDKIIKEQLKAQDQRERNIAKEREFDAQAQLQKMREAAKEKGIIADFTNTLNFQTTRWGVFNCDKPINYPTPFTASVALLWAGNQIAKFRQLFVFNLDKNNRYTYGNGTRTIEEFGLQKNDSFVIIGIDFDGNVGYLELKSFKENNQFEKFIFTKKDKSTKTLDLLTKLLNETNAVT